MIQNCPLHSEPDPKRRCWSSEEGANLVESALSMAILLSMILGIMEICLALYSYNYVAEAARVGARYAIVRGSSCPGCIATSDNIQTYVRGLAYPGINNATVTAAWPDTGSSCTPSSLPCNNPGNNVRVTVTYPFNLNIPFISSTTINMTSTSKMIISY
jgi:Flp pilus assembly protein TadG